MPLFVLVLIISMELLVLGYACNLLDTSLALMDPFCVVMFIGMYVALCDGLVSWCVAIGPQLGIEETPPTRRIAVPSGYKLRSLATEQKRNVQPDMAMTHFVL